MRKLATLMVGILIFVSFSGLGTATNIIVEPGTSIQAAVSGASSGDVIIVKPGTYTENIRVTTTPDLVIRSESGNPEDTIITAENSSTSVFYITVDNTTISGFKITGVESSDASGIFLVRRSNCIISNNNVSGNYWGLYLRSCQRNTLSNNIVDSNKYGIVLESASYNTLSKNIANSNSAYGFYLTNSSNCELADNTASSNERGIYLIRSNSTTISGNTVSENSAYGILTSYSNYNTISGNTANQTYRGIHLDSSDGNTVSGNTVASNSVSGLYMCAGSDSNNVFNNYLNNNVNADIRNNKNTWNTTKALGTNIVGGSYLGGNFWANPSGTGFSQTAQDANGDGIADSEYAETYFTDYLPLVLVSGKQQSVLPVASFTANTTSGTAPLTVKFTDTSQYATGWKWDFENDGSVDSSLQNPVHIFTVAGAYTVSLTASNTNGTSSKFMTIVVYDPSQPLYPVADFTANVTSGYAPLSVQFTDNSQSAVSWNWDFDSDGIFDSELQNPVHVYESPGAYTVNLSVSNQNGTSSKTDTITVLEDKVSKVLPVADFSMNVSEGYAPLSVLYTDLSQNATEIAWDFNNDGEVEVSSSPVVYVYTSAGTYTVNLIASNENGTTSKTATIDVKKKSSGGSSHSSGGSGGAGGSPEPQSNVEVKELSQVFIANGKAIEFDFTKNATCAVYVGFDARKTVGKTTTIVEQLKNKSTLVSNLTDGEVYKYFNVWVGNSGFASAENIENPVIGFKVEKTWLEDNNIDQDSIALNRYSGKAWDELPVNLSGEDSTYLYFTTNVSGYSFFAITGKANILSGESVARMESESEISSFEENNTENTGSQLGKEAGVTENMKASGLEIFSGIICLGAVFLYIRKINR